MNEQLSLVSRLMNYFYKYDLNKTGIEKNVILIGEVTTLQC